MMSMCSARGSDKSLKLSASHLGAGPELQLPLVLVLLAPLELTICDGLAAHDDFVSGMFIRSAGDSLQLALCHRRLAAEATSISKKGHEDQCKHCNCTHCSHQIALSG